MIFEATAPRSDLAVNTPIVESEDYSAEEIIKKFWYNLSDTQLGKLRNPKPGQKIIVRQEGWLFELEEENGKYRIKKVSAEKPKTQSF